MGNNRYLSNVVISFIFDKITTRSILSQPINKTADIVHKTETSDVKIKLAVPSGNKTQVIIGKIDATILTSKTFKITFFTNKEEDHSVNVPLNMIIRTTTANIAVTIFDIATHSTGKPHFKPK